MGLYLLILFGSFHLDFIKILALKISFKAFIVKIKYNSNNRNILSFCSKFLINIYRYIKINSLNLIIFNHFFYERKQKSIHKVFFWQNNSTQFMYSQTKIRFDQWDVPSGILYCTIDAQRGNFFIDLSVFTLDF